MIGPYSHASNGLPFRNPNGQIILRLKIRNLWTFDRHPRGSSANYECSTHIKQPIANVSTVICGMRIVVTLEFVGGKTKHLLMDWSTCQAMVCFRPWITPVT